MSMSYYPIMMYGVSDEDIDIKEEWLSNSDENAKYCDFDEFFDGELGDDGILGYAIGEEIAYIGIWASQAWNMSAMEKGFSEDDAKAYIAKALAPYCNNTEEEIAAACHEIEDTYYG